MRVLALHGIRDLRIEEQAEPDLGPHDVRLAFGAGGISVQDLHYYYYGRYADFALQEPLILGHELCSDVVEVGAGVSRVKMGERVAVEPVPPVTRDPSSLPAEERLLRRMAFYGSAAVTPHVQGGFRDRLVVHEGQCHVVPTSVAHGVAAMADPLAVSLHAISRAGPLLGRDVLITGAGTIGCLICAAVRRAGAHRVTVTDVAERPLEKARDLGADEAINAREQAERLEALTTGQGRVDVAFEASGNPQALANCLEAVRPGGRILQVGAFAPGGIQIPGHKLMAKEISLQGSMRFEDEFAIAVTLLAERRIDVSPLLTGQFSFDEAERAFALAGQRDHAMKVQLAP